MKNLLFVIFIFLCGVYACRKEKPPVREIRQIFLNIPFEVTTKYDCMLVDSVFDSLSNSNQQNKVHLSLDSIKDFRDYGIECMSSQGGYASITASVFFNDNEFGNYSLNMPGCADDNEWDTINSNAPRCTIDVYKLYLLKLYPITSSSINGEKPNTISDYRAKYVFKKLN